MQGEERRGLEITTRWMCCQPASLENGPDPTKTLPSPHLGTTSNTYISHYHSKNVQILLKSIQSRELRKCVIILQVQGIGLSIEFLCFNCSYSSRNTKTISIFFVETIYIYIYTRNTITRIIILMISINTTVQRSRLEIKC